MIRIMLDSSMKTFRVHDDTMDDVATLEGRRWCYLQYMQRWVWRRWGDLDGVDIMSAGPNQDYVSYVARRNQWLALFGELLERAIQKLPEPTRGGTTLRLALNGRSYWYRSEYIRKDLYRWARLHWPENETVEIRKP